MFRRLLVLLAAATIYLPASGRETTVAPQPDELPLPTVPAALRTPRERAAYILDHFWDAMDFADTLRCRNATFVEQHFANFASLFPHADTAVVRRVATGLLRRAEQDPVGYRLFVETVEKYLYEPESPLYDEGHYSFFLVVLLRTQRLDASEKLRYRYQQQAIAKNRPGTRAADFAYLDRDGRRRTLLDTPAERLLLLFYDPECTHCTEVMERLESDVRLSEAVAAGNLSVLAIFADGDRTSWLRTADKIPSVWSAGLDITGIQEHDRYVLRNLPALYLLDRDKTVVLKEPTAEALFEYLSRTASDL